MRLPCIMILLVAHHPVVREARRRLGRANPGCWASPSFKAASNLSMTVRSN